MKRSLAQYKKKQAQYLANTAKRGNKPNSIILTTKAVKTILLALKTAKRNTDEEREYLKWIARKLESQL